MLIKKSTILLAIIAILVIFISICYGLGLEEADDNDDFIEIIQKGFEKIIATLTPEEETPEDEEEDDDVPSTWNEKTQVTGGGSVGGGDMSNEFFGCGYAMDPFSPGAGNIRIEFYFSWYPDGCSSSECAPGVVWCLHDSTGTQIYHDTKPIQGSYGPYTVVGTWDGSTQWEVRVGNNCPCPIDTYWTLKIYKLE